LILVIIIIDFLSSPFFFLGREGRKERKKERERERERAGVVDEKDYWVVFFGWGSFFGVETMKESWMGYLNPSWFSFSTLSLIPIHSFTHKHVVSLPFLFRFPLPKNPPSSPFCSPG
jgi:hypothetical protein